MREAIGGAALLALILLVAGWCFVLQGQQGDLKKETALLQRDHDDLRKNSTLLPAMDDRLKKVEGVLELLVRDKDNAASGATRHFSIATVDGQWKVEFRQGTSGHMVLSAIDDTTLNVVGKEDKDGGLEIRGTGEINTGKLVVRYRATSAKYPSGFNGITVLTRVSRKLLKGYFTNDNGDFDLVTAKRED